MYRNHTSITSRRDHGTVGKERPLPGSTVVQFTTQCALERRTENSKWSLLCE